MTAEPRTFTVEVVEAETVAGRGTGRVNWFVRRGDAWVRVADYPGATTERRNAGPGTVWERAVRLALPAGVELVREEVRPGGERPKDPLFYLQRGSAATRPRTSRVVYSVDPRGRLCRLHDRKDRA